MTHMMGSGGEPAPRTRRRDPQRTRDRLVRAALELFTSQGYHASTTPQIAQRAGVAEGTIYRHFASKESLLNEIYRAALRVLGQRVRDVNADLSCRERLDQIATAFTGMAIKDPALMRLVFVSRLRGLLDSDSRQAVTAFHDDIQLVIAAGKSTGAVRPGQVDLLADIWLELVGLLVARAANREWTDTHPSVRQIIDSAWFAIARAP